MANPRGYKNIGERGWNEAEMGCSEVELRSRGWNMEKTEEKQCCDDIKKMDKMFNCGWNGRYEANPRGYNNIGKLGWNEAEIGLHEAESSLDWQIH